MNCKNCNNEVSLNYCPKCGQPTQLKRIDGHYIIHEIEHVLHFEKGILYTIRELMTRPGDNIRRFLTESRTRLVKPIIFIIVTSLIYSAVNHFFRIEEQYVEFSAASKSTTGMIFGWVQSHYGYANIIMGCFISLWLKLFFRKYGYNFFEILILLCFVMGMGMLILAVFGIIKGLLNTSFDMMQISGYILILYLTWAIGQFFDKKKAWSYIKAFASYLLGMFTFGIALYILGALIDTIIKH
jgi:hypothetical protein